MSEEDPSSKRARIIGNHQDEHSEEDQWKLELRDWFQGRAAPKRALRTSQEDIVEDFESDEEEEEYDSHSMIERLLELPSKDPAGDEAFAALMENAVYCYNNQPHTMPIHLGLQDDYPYSELTESSLPYLKKFLSVIPKNMKSMRLLIRSPEILRAFPDQIGTEGSTLEEISIAILTEMEYYSQKRHQESLSLANILYVTRNVKEVSLNGFHVLRPNHNTRDLLAFQSKTKKIGLSDTIICEQSAMFLHPDTTASLESIRLLGLKFASGLNALKESRRFWRQWFKASRQALSTLNFVSLNFVSAREDMFAGMCIEAANQNLENIKKIELGDINTDLLQPLNHLVGSRVASTLERLELNRIRSGLLPSRAAQAVASFENLQEVVFEFADNKGSNQFLVEFLSHEPQAVRKIDVRGRIDLSAASFDTLFSTKTLESIKVRDCRRLFSACEKSFSLKNLRSLAIGSHDLYNHEHILRVLEVLPDLRCLEIGGVEAMDHDDTRRIVNGIIKHSKLCLFECQLRTDGRRSLPDLTSAFNRALRLPCLRNRFKASEKQLPLGFIPKVILRSEELCGPSGIFQFLKEQAPSYLGS